LVRVRIINTDRTTIRGWITGAPYRIVAVDGTDVRGPTPLTGSAIPVPAGGRVDVEFDVPRDRAVRVDVGSGAALVFGPDRAEPPPEPTEPASTVDLLTYGTRTPIGFDPTMPDRRFTYRIDRSPGLLDGRPGLWWTINGHHRPEAATFMVSTGDVVFMTVANTTGEAHAMHLHGHHAVVLSRNGVAATGSPWWVDSLGVDPGDIYEIAFVADNPGIWANHCDHWTHASDGLVTYVAYTGVSSPFRVGGKTDNTPN
jgi:FtsP/CotA-like multicopper oxidase with cupredoxin domain